MPAAKKAEPVNPPQEPELVPIPTPKVYKARESEFRVEAVSVFLTHHHAPANGVPFEALLQHAYWVNLTRLVKPWSRIVVDYDGEDGPYTATLIVLDVNQDGATVVVDHKTEFSRADVLERRREPIYKVRYDIQKRYCVVRISDNRQVADNLATRAAADRWITDNMKALAA